MPATCADDRLSSDGASDLPCKESQRVICIDGQIAIERYCVREDLVVLVGMEIDEIVRLLRVVIGQDDLVEAAVGLDGILILVLEERSAGDSFRFFAHVHFCLCN